MTPSAPPHVATVPGASTRPAPARVVRRAPRRAAVACAVLGVGVVCVVVLSAGTGQLVITPAEVLGSFVRAWNDWVSGIGATALRVPPGEPMSHVNGDVTLWTVRLPRIVLGLVVGAALAVSGVVMQGVFRNPLAEPGVIGVSSGAAVGACAVIVFGWTFAGSLTLPLFAFLGAITATVAVYAISRNGGRTEVVTLVLTGIAVNALGTAGVALFTFLGTAKQRDDIVFWQLGSLAGARWDDVAVVAPLAVAGLAAAALMTGRLDLLALGERQAAHLGLRVERLRAAAIVLISLLTGVAVALCGVIAFVGLVVPHAARMVVGSEHRGLVPVSALGGALLIAGADLAARAAVPSAELPIGLVTGLVGGPVFFWLLLRTRHAAGGWA